LKKTGAGPVIPAAATAPAAFSAVTTARMLEAESRPDTVYVFDVAPLMGEQLAPCALQSCHW
jgi:hypothetical protein